MKKILTLLLALAWTTSAWTTNITIDDPVVLVVRSIFLDGNYGTPDSVRITTWYSGSQAYDAWFNTGDSECYAANGWLAFTDVFSDIDGGGGDGSYTVIISAYDDDSTLYTDRAYSYTVGGSVESVTGAVGSVAGDIGGLAAGAIDDVWEADTSTMSAAAGIGTIIKEASDSTIANLDEAISGIDDNPWDDGSRTLTALGFALDSLDYEDSTFIAALFATNFWAELADRADSGSVIWNTTQRDSVLAALADAGFKALIQQVLDTLQVYDNTGRFQALIASYLDAAISSRSVAGDEMDLVSGAVDSVALALTFLYEFWAYNDSTAIDLDNALSTWMQNNLAGGAGAGADSTEVYGAVVQVLEDSTSKYQGAASGLDAAEIADTLTNRGVTTGNGQYYDTLIVLNTVDSTAIANMGFDILPLDGGTPLARVTTDGNGSAVARLEAESLSVRLIFQGYTFNTKDTLVIAGSQTDTLWGTGVVLPAPPADMVTIVMGLITANFDTLNPTYVYWRPVKSTGKAYKKSDELYYGTGVNALAIQKDWTIETSTTSVFSFSVFANANLSDTLGQYEFWLYWVDGRITQKITAVPDQASFNPIGQ